jgi:hypothetical protein
VKGDNSTFVLKAKKRRMSWVPEKVELWMRDDEILEFSLLHGDAWPAGTAECANQLEALGVGADAGMRAACQAMRDAGHKRKNEVIRAAQRYRREMVLRAGIILPEAVDNDPLACGESVPRSAGHAATDDQRGTPRGTPAENPEKPLRNRVPQLNPARGAHPPSADGAHSAPLKGALCPSATPDDPTDDPDDITEELF